MIFVKNFARNYEKKIILGTSDAWCMSHLSQRPCAVYYVEECRISVDPSGPLLYMESAHAKANPNVWL